MSPAHWGKSRTRVKWYTASRNSPCFRDFGERLRARARISKGKCFSEEFRGRLCLSRSFSARIKGTTGGGVISIEEVIPLYARCLRQCTIYLYFAFSLSLSLSLVVVLLLFLFRFLSRLLAGLRLDSSGWGFDPLSYVLRWICILYLLSSLFSLSLSLSRAQPRFSPRGSMAFSSRSRARVQS